MKLVRVGCESCGGNLEVDPRERYVVCSYCKSVLELVYGQSSVTSRLVQELVGENELLSLKLQYHEAQKELKGFDEGWEKQKTEMMWRGRNVLYEPSLGVAMFQGSLLGLVLGLLLISFDLSIDVSVVIAVVALAALIEWRRHQIRRFRAAVDEMEGSRRKLLERISELAAELTSRGFPVRQPNGKWESIFPPEKEVRYEDFF